MTLLSALRRTALASMSSKSSLSSRLLSTCAASVSNLLRVLDSEIECSEQSVDHYWMGEVADRFPFDLKDEPGSSVVVLTRNYEKESIEVEACMSNLITGDKEEEEEEEEEEGDIEDMQNPAQFSVPLVVKLSKGENLCMEFHCTAFPDEISIESLLVKEGNNSNQVVAFEGRDFSELDEDLQKYLRKYLEIRGILPSNMNFLHEYMINKDGREYLLWLKNLKTFIQK